MVVVDKLDEGLECGTLGDLLEALVLGHTLGGLGETSNECVAEFAWLAVEGVDDHSLLAGVATIEDDDDLQRVSHGR